MTFNSLEFLIFSLLFFSLWPLLRKGDSSRWSFITIASFIFYGWWDWRFLFLIIGSGLIDFICGLSIYNNPKNRKLYLILSIVGNIGSLSIFKYNVFFANIIEDGFLLFNIHLNLVNSIPAFTLILPIGISFYTFQSLSYTIDVYRGRLSPTKNILHFFSYLSMFPQLVAGPIVRAKDFLKQLATYKVPSPIQKWNAFKLICFGLFQKMVIADNLSFFIDSAFENKSGFNGSIYWWVVMIAFSFQIYCDFSGYSLIARGLAKYMGYHFKMNFNHPYLSTSLKDFWSRWHISLSTWFRDYIYIPMGGGRRGTLIMIVSLSVTMGLSGLWHGANYTFLVWALAHTFLLIVEKLTKWNKRIKLSDYILIPIIFTQVVVAWVYFRAGNIHQGNQVVMKMFSIEPSDMSFIRFYLDNLFFLLIAIAIEIAIFFRNKRKSIMTLYYSYHLDMVMVILCIVSIFFLRGEGKQFIYFQF